MLLLWLTFDHDVDAEPMTQEEEWREDCLEFARLKNLRHVEEMRIFSAVSELTDESAS